MHDSILPITKTITPVDQDEAVTAVASAIEAGKPIYPLGGRTNLGYGASVLDADSGAALPTGLGISTEKLNRIIDHAHRDMTVTVEAGVSVAKLAKLLAAKNQRLPVDVPAAARATVGGAVACGLAGPRRFGYGLLRDYVIGVQAVDGNGTRFAGGGRVVKNAAGYDICRLMTGSLGTLGLITQITLMVRPLVRRSAMLVCKLRDFETADRLLADLVTSETLPAAVELLAGPLWSDDPALEPLDGDTARLLVAFEGSTAEVEWMIDTLSRRWKHVTGLAPTAVHKSQVEPLWGRLVEFPLTTKNAEESPPLVVQIETLPSMLVGLVQQIRRLNPQVSIQAHAGDGVIRARFPIEPNGSEQDTVVKLLSDDLRPAMTAAGAGMVVLSCPPQVKLDKKAVWGPNADPADAGRAASCIGLMRNIKQRFDPQGLFNPGRFIF